MVFSVVQLEGRKRKMKAENVETTVRDDKEFKGTVIYKKNGICVVEFSLGRHGFQLNGSKSSCGLEGPVEVKVGSG